MHCGMPTCHMVQLLPAELVQLAQRHQSSNSGKHIVPMYGCTQIAYCRALYLSKLRGAPAKAPTAELLVVWWRYAYDQMQTNGTIKQASLKTTFVHVKFYLHTCVPAAPTLRGSIKAATSTSQYFALSRSLSLAFRFQTNT